MKGFSLDKAILDGFYFCSAVGRRSIWLWILFFITWGLSLSQTILSELLQNNLLQQLRIETVLDPFIFQKVLDAFFNPTFFIVFLGVSILTLIAQMILQKVAILSHRFSGEDIQPDFFKISWKVILNYIWLMFIFNLLVFAGLLLFIIPGIVWAYTYVFAPYMLLDRKEGTRYSFHMGRRLINGVRWECFLCTFLIGVIAAVLITAVTIPFYHFLYSEFMFSFVKIWSSFLTTFFVFYLVFFQASIYRQLIESIKFNPSIDPEFVKNYFVVRYPDEEAEINQNPQELSTKED